VTLVTFSSDSSRQWQSPWSVTQRRGGERRVESSSTCLMVLCTEDGGSCATEVVMHAVLGHQHTLDDHDQHDLSTHFMAHGPYR
jgi:hypothetical protein